MNSSDTNVPSENPDQPNDLKTGSLQTAEAPILPPPALTAVSSAAQNGILGTLSPRDKLGDPETGLEILSDGEEVGLNNLCADAGVNSSVFLNITDVCGKATQQPDEVDELMRELMSRQTQKDPRFAELLSKFEARFSDIPDVPDSALPQGGAELARDVEELLITEAPEKGLWDRVLSKASQLSPKMAASLASLATTMTPALALAGNPFDRVIPPGGPTPPGTSEQIWDTLGKGAQGLKNQLSGHPSSAGGFDFEEGFIIYALSYIFPRLVVGGPLSKLIQEEGVAATYLLLAMLASASPDILDGVMPLAEPDKLVPFLVFSGLRHFYAYSRFSPKTWITDKIVTKGSKFDKIREFPPIKGAWIGRVVRYLLASYAAGGD